MSHDIIKFTNVANTLLVLCCRIDSGKLLKNISQFRLSQAQSTRSYHTVKKQAIIMTATIVKPIIAKCQKKKKKKKKKKKAKKKKKLHFVVQAWELA